MDSINQCMVCLDIQRHHEFVPVLFEPSPRNARHGVHRIRAQWVKHAGGREPGEGCTAEQVIASRFFQERHGQQRRRSASSLHLLGCLPDKALEALEVR